MSPVQMRMARAALGWSVRDLATKADVSANTISRIETGADAKGSTLDAIRQALEDAGVEFTNGDSYGVKVPKPPRPPKA